MEQSTIFLCFYHLFQTEAHSKNLLPTHDRSQIFNNKLFFFLTQVEKICRQIFETAGTLFYCCEPALTDTNLCNKAAPKSLLHLNYTADKSKLTSFIREK